jgi:hypothetical protein
VNGVRGDFSVAQLIDRDTERQHSAGFGTQFDLEPAGHHIVTRMLQRRYVAEKSIVIYLSGVDLNPPSHVT